MSEDIVMMMEREAGAPEQVPQLGIGFYVKPVKDAKRSKLAGHPVFVDKEWVCIVIPGDRNSRIERVATEQDKQRFPRSYAAFKQREQKPIISGFAIEEWPQVTRAMAMTLKAANIPTVEALAEVSDAHIGKLGFEARDLRAKAQAFLAVSKDTAAAQQIQAESDRKDALIADQQRQIGDLAARLEKLERKTGKAAMVA